MSIRDIDNYDWLKRFFGSRGIGSRDDMRGGFFDMDLAKILGIDMEEEIPLYAMALGIPDDVHKNGRVPAMGSMSQGT